MLKKKKFLIGGIIILVGIAYLGWVGFQRSATYYYNVEEFLVQARTDAHTNVKVNGQVAPGSIQRSGARNIRFELAEGAQKLPVVYEGAVPDAFAAGIEVVVEGRMSPSGVFEARTILTKCPSKYETS